MSAGVDERAARIERCARELLEAVDRNHDTLPWPQKYGVPYGAVNRLREALEGSDATVESATNRVGVSRRVRRGAK